MKKTIIFLSVLTMMTACLTGCAGTQQPASTPVETLAATTEAAPETTEAAAEQLIGISRRFGVDARVIGRVEQAAQSEVVLDTCYGNFKYVK